MIPEECKFFENCDAPICSLDSDKDEAIWFPDEAICKNSKFSKLQFIKTQKKISRLNSKNGIEGAFTFNMLNHNFLVRSGIKGINEDLSLEEFEAKEKAWIQMHKGISEGFHEKKKAIISEARGEIRL